MTKMRVKQLLDGFKKRELSPKESAKDLLKKVKEENPLYNDFITINENIVKDAEQSEERYHKNTPLPLDGLIISVKDNIIIKDMLTSCGSKMLSNFVPRSYESTVIEALRNNGVHFIGKTNMDEFACGSSTKTSFYGPTLNPINREYTPGGSSGGSACAVARGHSIISLGSDTGGSVRQPASFCGIVGFKPSYGILSRWGVVAYASSLDQIGIMANNVSDIAAILQYTYGEDDRDTTTSNVTLENIDNFLPIDVKNKRIALLKIDFNSLESDIRDEAKKIQEIIDSNAKKLQALGAIVEEIDIPLLKESSEIYTILSRAELASNLAKFDGTRFGHMTEKDVDIKSIYYTNRDEGFGDEIKKRILVGDYVLQGENNARIYQKALKIRGLIKNELDTILNRYDFILNPTSPILPFKLDKERESKIADMMLVYANLAGLPAISIPCGKIGEFSVGMHLTSKRFNDGILLGVSEFIHDNLN